MQGLAEFALASAAPAIAIFLELTNAWPDRHVHGEIKTLVQDISAKPGAVLHLERWAEGLVLYRTVFAAGLAPILPILPLFVHSRATMPLIADLILSIVVMVMLARLVLARDFFALSTVYVNRFMRFTPAALYRATLVANNVAAIAVMWWTTILRP